MALHAGAKPILTLIGEGKREAPTRGPKIMAALRPAAFPRGRTNLRPHTTTQNEDMGSGQRNRDQGHAGVDHEARLKRLAE